jgi:hypothetical protein
MKVIKTRDIRIMAVPQTASTSIQLVSSEILLISLVSLETSHPDEFLSKKENESF